MKFKLKGRVKYILVTVNNTICTKTTEFKLCKYIQTEYALYIEGCWLIFKLTLGRNYIAPVTIDFTLCFILCIIHSFTTQVICFC